MVSIANAALVCLALETGLHPAYLVSSSVHRRGRPGAPVRLCPERWGSRAATDDEQDSACAC